MKSKNKLHAIQTKASNTNENDIFFNIFGVGMQIEHGNGKFAQTINI
jgi:hypothetical protein